MADLFISNLKAQFSKKPLSRQLSDGYAKDKP
jgi:hypothetical protein